MVCGPYSAAIGSATFNLLECCTDVLRQHALSRTATLIRCHDSISSLTGIILDAFIVSVCLQHEAVRILVLQ